MTYRHLTLERDGPLAVVKFNDPTQLNALGLTLLQDFVAAMDALLSDARVRAILLTGEGRSFCAGANLKEFAAAHEGGHALDVGATLRALNPILLRMVRSSKPIIAAVNGPAVGAGCGIALCADIVLVGRSGYFFQSFIRIGVVPDGGSTWVLPRLVGRSRAAAMMMLGDRIDAETALKWGLAYKICDDALLLNEAREIAMGLANGPTLAYGKIKEMLNASDRNDFEAQLDLEEARQNQAFKTEDCVEGIAAFVQKRPPKFRGA